MMLLVSIVTLFWFFRTLCTFAGALLQIFQALVYLILAGFYFAFALLERWTRVLIQTPTDIRE